MFQTRATQALLLALAGLAAAIPAHAEEPRELLSESLEPRVKGYQGEQVTEVTPAAGGRKRATRQQVFRSGNRLLIRYRNGRVVFDNGQEQLVYLPAQGTAERRPSQFSRARLAQQRRALRNGRIAVTQLPDGDVAGIPSYVVSVKMPSGVERRVWIDKERRVQLRQDEVRPAGRAVSTYFTRISFEDPQGAASFELPADVRIVDRLQGRPLPAARAAQRARAWGGLLQPRQVPAGYVLRGYYPHTFKGQAGLVGVYDGPGNKTFSVFQGPAIGSGTMSPRKRNRLQVLSAPRGSAVVTVIGPEGEDLQKVVDSMAPADP
jgi:hypothetical protein